MNYQYHHIGIPVSEKMPNERYSEPFKMYTSGGELPLRIQYHRFEKGCPLHPLIQTQPHVAFKVDKLSKATAGKKIIMQPYEPFTNFRVAMIEENGMPIELIETNLSEAEIWNDETHKDSLIYPKKKPTVP